MTFVGNAALGVPLTNRDVNFYKEHGVVVKKTKQPLSQPYGCQLPLHRGAFTSIYRSTSLTEALFISNFYLDT